MKPVLEVVDLKTHFEIDEGTLKAVDGVTFHVDQRKTLGIIGESGCGKSVTARSILQIVEPPGRVVSGQIILHRRDGSVVDLATLDPRGQTIRRVRGKEISMIFQEPMRSLSPVHTIGRQIVELLLLHKTQNRAKAEEIGVDMLHRVGMSNPRLRFNSYPHQLSGGLCQRAMIAMALLCQPSLLIADEPTTALDVTVQAQIVDLILDLQEQYGMSILYITHDLGVIAELAQDVAVMYMGKIVEYAKTSELFENPLHPYTVGLLKSIPRLGKKQKQLLETIKGTVPIPLDLPRQCGFYTRCPAAIPGTCNAHIPALVEVSDGHFVRCFLQSEEREVSA